LEFICSDVGYLNEFDAPNHNCNLTLNSSTSPHQIDTVAVPMNQKISLNINQLTVYKLLISVDIFNSTLVLDVEDTFSTKSGMSACLNLSLQSRSFLRN